MQLLKPKIFLLFILPLTIFLSFNKHSKDKSNSYHGVIWADAAGYYIYQPMWFIYGNNPALLPDSVQENCGNGFQLDFINNKIITKYSCGVSLLQTPFFLIAHALSQPLGFKSDGFSKIYSFAIYFSGVFFCCMGLFLLSHFLLRHFSPLVSILAPLLFFAASNLYYYSIDAPGMSHIYSFFLFCCILYLSPFIISKSNFSYLFLFFSSLMLVIITRPTNILIGLFPLLYNIKDKNDFFLRLKYLYSNKLFITIAAAASLIFSVPQLLYWYNNTGHLFSYSYGNESFVFWDSPKIMEVWFSTNNGLFLYTPIIIASLAGVFLMIKNKLLDGYFIGFLFLIITYIFASWWNWWFGCAFGARSYVEYYSIFIISFAYLLERALQNKIYRYAIIIFIAFCCYLNMDIEYYYDGCFHGGTWDLATYLKLLNS